ncbi:ABC transporter ATP-binding protein [Pseudobacteroides cellulosolvens]|uniref:Sulfate-transporting ATPase n=1 Tax=Pseudobacteroides cellulosolvens ATCC 35603 = DSM 2933 TaxID=398512 RepID=A0A0L6JHQ4_9FIRM|nr:ABC transporter ATP-binding protein [Pseudobacteroides cellulosolvens]KNY25243.1 Sulfate-transporting ATPase [Pseudobacteroides cellulosolvens ATCC 35603 = DSM 2933]
MVIETNNITKFYGKKLGCKDISISVKEGEIFGFLGPNGAGKSTFIKIMTGLLFPTSGTAMILGKPLNDISVRRRIGFLPENFKYGEWMTGEDLLSFHASLYKLDKNFVKERIREVLSLVKLTGHEKYKLGTYSKGMQQRLGLASALLPDPDLLFLDEPTSALDPIGRKEVRDIMTELKRRGKTILLNSHLLSEVEMVCDSLVIINKGSVVIQGDMQELLKGEEILHIHAEDISGEILNMLKKIDEKLVFENNRISMKVNSKDDVQKTAAIIVNGGGKLYELKTQGTNLESKFISLIEGGDKK